MKILSEKNTSKTVSQMDIYFYKMFFVFNQKLYDCYVVNELITKLIGPNRFFDSFTNNVNQNIS